LTRNELVEGGGLDRDLAFDRGDAVGVEVRLVVQFGGELLELVREHLDLLVGLS
jgi:hypothetical protein